MFRSSTPSGSASINNKLGQAPLVWNVCLTSFSPVSIRVAPNVSVYLMRLSSPTGQWSPHPIWNSLCCQNLDEELVCFGEA